MRTIPDNQKLLDLIADARMGKIVLPQFQRDFIWSREDISALLMSVLQGHFIGSLLFLNTDDEVPFACRPLQGVNPQGLHHPEMMVLDGQQRLTSLHYAFAAPDIPLHWSKYPYRFFLDLRKVTENDWEKAITSERAMDCNGMLDRQKQFETLVVPFTELEQWNNWVFAYEQWLIKKDSEAYFQQYFQKEKEIWYGLMNQLNNFVVPTITLPKIKQNDSDSLAEVCTVFEKINSTGVKLSVYDLLTARLYKDKIDLHQLWEKAIDDYHLLDDYSEGSPDEFGVYVLRTIALMRNLDIKSKSLINLSPVNFEKDWKIAVGYMEKALKRMTSWGTDGFGAFDRKWMPYLTMVSPLAAMLYAIDNKKFGHQAYHWIQRWYWSAVFRERYAGAIESTIYRDYQDLLRSMDNPTYEPDSFQQARVGIIENTGFSLKSVSRLNSLYRGVICLIALRGAKDFAKDDAIEFHILEDHHIFPAAYLGKLRGTKGEPLYSADKINCVLNRTLIADRTNKLISKSNPGQYLKEIFPAEGVTSILSSHFIDRETQEAMIVDNFDAFLNAREKALLEEIVRRIKG